MDQSSNQDIFRTTDIEIERPRRDFSLYSDLVDFIGRQEYYKSTPEDMAKNQYASPETLKYFMKK